MKIGVGSLQALPWHRIMLFVPLALSVVPALALAPSPSVSPTSLVAEVQPSSWVAAAHARIASGAPTLALEDIPSLAGTALASFSIESPVATDEGEFVGSVQIMGAKADAILHPMRAGIDSARDGGGDGWALSIDISSKTLGELIPALAGTPAGDLGLRRTALVLATADARVDETTMGAETRDFYARYFESPRMMLEVSRGVNALTRIQTSDGSPLGAALNLLGLKTSGVLLQGTLLKDASFKELRKAHKNKELGTKLRESMELRAYLPPVRLGGLPDSYTAGETSLIVSGKPGVGLAFRLVAAGATAATSQAFECRVDVAKSSATVTEVQIMGTALGVWEDALGIVGFDLIDPRLLLEVDTAQRVGFGVRAGFNVGAKEMALSAKLQLHAVTGAPLGGFFEGRLSSIGSSDLVAMANAMGAARGKRPIDASEMASFELKDLYLKFAPTEGDSDLGTSDGFALRGELHAFDTEFAYVDGEMNLNGLIPTIRLEGECADVDLGALALKDAGVDIHLGATLDQHFKIKGATKLLAMKRTVDVHCSLKGLYFDTTEELGGVYRTAYHFSSPAAGRPTWKVRAAVGNQLSKTLEEDVSRAAKKWADGVQSDSANARKNLDEAKAEVRNLDQAIAAERARVRARRDKQGAALRKAQAKVASIQDGIDAVRKAITTSRNAAKEKVAKKKKASDDAHTAWRKAVKARKNAPVLKRPKLRIAEGKKLADYTAKAAAYEAANRAYKIRVKLPIDADARIVTMFATKKTALAALKVAEGATELTPVDADVKVASLITAKTTALASLEVAKAAVGAGGAVLGAAGNVSAWVAKHNGALVMIDAMSFEVNLADYLAGNAVELCVDARLLGKAKDLKMRVAPAEFGKGVIAKALLRELKKLSS